MSRSKDLRRPGWLNALLERYLAGYELAQTTARVEHLRSLQPGLQDELADRLTHERLEELALRVGLGLPVLRQRAAHLELSEGEREAAGLLCLQWDLLQDLAYLSGDRAGPDERRLQLMTLMALGSEDYALARELHARRHELTPRQVAALAARLEKRMAPHGRLAGLRPASAGFGLLYLQARVQARIAAQYFQALEVEEHAMSLLHHLSRREKLDLLRILIALAWVDGEVVPEERALIEQQIGWARLEPAAVRELQGRLQQPYGLADLELAPLDPGGRRCVLEQAVLMTLIDDEQSESEVEALRELAVRLGGDQAELDTTMIRVTAFYLRHRDAVLAAGNAKAMSSLQRVMFDRVQAAVRDNLRAIVQEVKETGELALLLGAASRRPLTREEVGKVKAQLLDIAKSVPALAIFALPGGGILLPVLLKLLPFNVLPSAFAADPELSAPQPLPRNRSE